jgi:uncharacterized tellurite resistance protein B-like protein
MSILRRIFGLDATPAAPRRGPTRDEAESIRRIADKLDKMEPEEAKFIATFAFTLSRVAHADLEISDQETLEMERIVMEKGRLPEEQAILVVQIAKTQSRLFGSTDNYVVTREFGRLSTREQKLALLDCLFAVSAADENVSTVEDNEIRRIAEELKLEHSDFIAARSAYREHLAVLKKRGDRGRG